MKNIVLTLVVIFSSYLTNAQNPIIDLYSEKPSTIGGEYYQDVDNFQDQYVGTWLYTNGNTSIKIVFNKKTMFYDASNDKKYYEDLLIGEYVYIENGVQKVNTLNNLNITTTNHFDYNLYSVTRISKNKFPKCTECNENEYRMYMFINEPLRRSMDAPGHHFVMRKYLENGVEKLKVVFNTDSGMYFEDKATGSRTNLFTFSLPYGTYILTKQ
jgi:hypothetical protein